MKSNPLATLWHTLVGSSPDKPDSAAQRKKQFIHGKAYDAAGNLLPTSATLDANPYVGEIMMFAGNYAPLGWALCEGQLLSIAQNTTLFTLIGTTYGGDGQSTFGLPDLRGRIPLHKGTTNNFIGLSGGSEQVTLTAANIPTLAQSTPLAKVRATGTATVGATDGKLETATATLTSTGTLSQPHNNLPPYTVINFCIALEGIYPSQ